MVTIDNQAEGIKNTGEYFCVLFTCSNGVTICET
jgi:hypothetical protein